MIENGVCISGSIFPFLLERNGVNDDSHIVPVSEEWNLIVVNHWNEIPEDYSVTLTELSNGQKVDSWIYPYLQEIPFADIKNVIPHIQDSDMVELNLGVTVKPPPGLAKKRRLLLSSFLGPWDRTI